MLSECVSGTVLCARGGAMSKINVFSWEKASKKQIRILHGDNWYENIRVKLMI